ncbi:helix-turn-helix domain-containing protein [Tissierella carlieri]|uniref:Helix-turn-helix domain-containing protein n=1 Tax=Tissierella carlieri TaxID=689904 RepID=A0ABT1SFP2_9FIRM|nr:helix-turn-helix transcriptional regulator [Tissierella carlieri]MCQ4925311.1 helix-turn-helix domain-containing protein [Tissierella carlieri]
MENLLGKRIKFLREEKELSQLEFSKILNISNSTLSQYEAGNRMPGDEIKKKIAEYFNVSLDYLMGASNIRNPYQINTKSNDNEEQNLIPEEFTNADEARAYVNKHQIFGSGGFDADKLDDNEILEFANALLEQMKMVSYKYKK